MLLLYRKALSRFPHYDRHIAIPRAFWMNDQVFSRSKEAVFFTDKMMHFINFYFFHYAFLSRHFGILMIKLLNPAHYRLSRHPNYFCCHIHRQAGQV